MANSTLNIALVRQILLIPSIVLTKGLIASYVKVTSNEIKDALQYLLEKQLLIEDKYLLCGKRQINAYLKYVPQNIENRTNKYLLQKRLLEVDVNVNKYIDSIKTIRYATPSLSASNLLISKFEQTEYKQLNVNFVIKHKGMLALGN